MRMRPTKKAKVELLSRVSLFERCSQRELAQIGSFTYELEREPGTVLMTEGEHGAEFYIIVDGQASVMVGTEERPPMGPGSFFGDLALLDGGPRTATVTLTTHALLLVLSKAEFAALLDAAPSVAIKMLPVLGARLRRAEQTVASLRQAASERKV